MFRSSIGRMLLPLVGNSHKVMVNKVEDISGTLKKYPRTEVVEFEVPKVVLTSRDVEDGEDEEQGADGSNEGATAPASEELPANEGEDEERGGDGSSGCLLYTSDAADE